MNDLELMNRWPEHNSFKKKNGRWKYNGRFLPEFPEDQIVDGLTPPELETLSVMFWSGGSIAVLPVVGSTWLAGISGLEEKNLMKHVYRDNWAETTYELTKRGHDKARELLQQTMEI